MHTERGTAKLEMTRPSSRASFDAVVELDSEWAELVVSMLKSTSSNVVAMDLRASLPPLHGWPNLQVIVRTFDRTGPRGVSMPADDT